MIGPVFVPGEAGYALECGTYNLTTPLRPRIAVGAQTVADVQATERFAAERGLGVAIRGGSVSVAGRCGGMCWTPPRRWVWRL